MKNNKDKEIQELRLRLDIFSAIINELCDFLDYDKTHELIERILDDADKDSIV